MEETECGVSVIVCCHNSISRIEPTLRHLHEQEVSAGTKWEVVLVDNASTDETSEFARRCWAGFGSPGDGFEDFRIVFEEEPGLSHARRRGYEASRYDVLVFCDDDNWLSPMYVQTALQTMSASERIGIVGGRGSPVFEAGEPEWFRDAATSYAVGSQGDGDRGKLSRRLAVYGAGMVVRRKGLEILELCGYRLLQSGRKGETLSSGEDAKLCFLFRMMGYEIWYDNGLEFRHYMPAMCMTTSRYLRMIRGFGRAKLIASLYRQYLTDRDRFESHLLWEKEVVEIFKQFVLYWIKEIRTSPESDDALHLQVMVNWYGGMLQAFLTGRARFYRARQYLKDLEARLPSEPWRARPFEGGANG